MGDSGEATVTALGSAQFAVAVMALGESIAPSSLREGQARTFDDGVVGFGYAAVVGAEEFFDVCGEGVLCRGEDESTGWRVDTIEEEETCAVGELVIFVVEIVRRVKQGLFFVGWSVGMRCEASGFFESDEAGVVLCEDAGRGAEREWRWHIFRARLAVVEGEAPVVFIAEGGDHFGCPWIEWGARFDGVFAGVGASLAGGAFFDDDVAECAVFAEDEFDDDDSVAGFAVFCAHEGHPPVGLNDFDHALGVVAEFAVARVEGDDACLVGARWAACEQAECSDFCGLGPWGWRQVVGGVFLSCDGGFRRSFIFVFGVGGRFCFFLFGVWLFIRSLPGCVVCGAAFFATVFCLVLGETLFCAVGPTGACVLLLWAGLVWGCVRWALGVGRWWRSGWCGCFGGVVGREVAQWLAGFGLQVLGEKFARDVVHDVGGFFDFAVDFRHVVALRVWPGLGCALCGGSGILRFGGRERGRLRVYGDESWFWGAHFLWQQFHGYGCGACDELACFLRRPGDDGGKGVGHGFP